MLRLVCCGSDTSGFQVCSHVPGICAKFVYADPSDAQLYKVTLRWPCTQTEVFSALYRLFCTVFSAVTHRHELVSLVVIIARPGGVAKTEMWWMGLANKPMVEACGPVQISKGETFYIGATRVTNNTAEMQGVIEAPFWLNTCVERRTLHATNDVLITIDSLYVKELIDEILLPEKTECSPR